MRRHPLDSTAIASAGYDAGTAVLELEFTSGEVYRYFAVPPSVHRGLHAADSAGNFFRERIRDVYPSEHVRWGNEETPG
ncbi:KTSC domain-containing protein [Microbacterium sp. B35-04]|uniref:KTSC domain-containing protein n=1 Tax=unclassified Microbacterium TaxID=2609290 RepID=UPI0013D72FD3|nr:MULTISPECIES: KTSC domain-containing protein [unclassified Microbacterium]KAF2411953.1 KTSC domain-containing protein [Microbacterium sp. B35-04]KAF2419167.1 KTSC domain-containing protein [Microbacterium sp. B35-30]